MKKQKVTLKKLSLQKQTIASVHAKAIQGGTGITTTFLETRLGLICQTNPTGITIPVTAFSVVETKCVTDETCKTDCDPDTCPGIIIKTFPCY